ncbi:hypothetical protein E2C01_007480 [Portunus trituberculatus]|uniref:Uncharacterized protein n=1 Tax=Portunus trituberculatus TaxID=210409 RepID=A0A5B7CZC6_PORTR|nr:hypothetical protein [Portunus trituberculatus]
MATEEIRMQMSLAAPHRRSATLPMARRKHFPHTALMLDRNKKSFNSHRGSCCCRCRHDATPSRPRGLAGLRLPPRAELCSLRVTAADRVRRENKGNYFHDIHGRERTGCLGLGKEKKREDNKLPPSADSSFPTLSPSLAFALSFLLRLEQKHVCAECH